MKLSFRHQQRQVYSYHSIQQFEQATEQSVMLGELSISSSSAYTSSIVPKIAT